jgi:hypothetical protein
MATDFILENFKENRRAAWRSSLNVSKIVDRIIIIK